MIHYLHITSTDPYWNLALEQYLFDTLGKNAGYFMLWQNDSTVVIGKYQNTIAEINASFIRERQIKVVRRLSGGGTVYHDLGNLNFSFIANRSVTELDFSTYCEPMIRALRSFGVEAEQSGRNDIVIDGKKCSGNAQYYRNGKLLHHGTLLYDTDLSTLAKALNVPADKIEPKGVPSVRSRVTNIKPHMREPVTIDVFRDRIKLFMYQEHQCDITEYKLSIKALDEVQLLRDTKYALWDWNYGQSPGSSIRKERRVEGCGKIEVYMDVEEFKICRVAFYGDYFGREDFAVLAERLIGCTLEETPLRRRLAGVSIGDYFHNLSANQLVALLLC